MDLYDCLNSDSEADSVITGVFGIERRLMNDGSLRFDEITITFAKFYIHFSVNFDTDEIIIAAILGELSDVPNLLDISNDIPIVGKTFGWYWNAKNKQGYSDMFLFAVSDFGGADNFLEPRYLFLSAGSAISFLEIRK